MRVEQSSPSQSFGVLSYSVENVQFVEKASTCMSVFVVNVCNFSIGEWSCVHGYMFQFKDVIH